MESVEANTHKSGLHNFFGLWLLLPDFVVKMKVIAIIKHALTAFFYDVSF